MAARLLTGYISTQESYAVVDFLGMVVGDISGNVELLNQVETLDCTFDGPANFERRL